MGAVAIAISSCLLGEAVRYDGGHRRQDVLRAALDPHVDWLPFCPEVLAGLGVPRPPIRLEGPGAAPRVVEVEAQVDHTDALARAVAGIVAALQTSRVAGFIFKSRSPSCGVGDVPRFWTGLALPGVGDGVLVSALRAAYPDLPCVSELELTTPEACEAFLRRAQRGEG